MVGVKTNGKSESWSMNKVKLIDKGIFLGVYVAQVLMIY